MSIIKPILQHSEHVVYFSGANNYCWAHFRNGEKTLLAKPISYLESQLTSFVRVHKTVLLNPAYVSQLFPPATKKMAGRITLTGGIDVPVSRRRWAEVIERLQPTALNSVQPVTGETLATSPKPATKDILLVTDDIETARIVEQTVRQHGSEYQCQIAKDSQFLPSYLESLSAKDQPILLMIDARTAVTERLYLLGKLKKNSALCHLPIVLLASNEPMIVSGYRQQANSVLSFPVNSQPSQPMLERVCRFWLRMASLPALS
jgi:CheY-like chemotaxis protein